MPPRTPRKRKAISPIIATIIILLVTIAIAGAGYSYISTYWAGLVGKEIQVVSSFCAGEGQAKVMVKNIGTNPVRTGEITIINPNTGEDLTRNVAWSSSVTGHMDDPGLVLELMFEEGSGTTAKDTSGKGNDGTLYGDTAWVEGKAGKALGFDGDGDYVDSGNAVSLRPIIITVEAWVKPGSLNQGSGWRNAAAQYGGGSDGWVLRTTQNGNGHFTPHVYVGGWHSCDGGLLPLNEWSHIALTYDGETIGGYVNGNPVCQNGNPSGDLAITGPTTIGGNAGVSEPFHGTIDQVRIYSRALSPEEIAVLAGNFQVQPGETATLTHACPGRCRYNLVLGGMAKETMLEC